MSTRGVVLWRARHAAQPLTPSVQCASQRCGAASAERRVSPPAPAAGCRTRGAQACHVPPGNRTAPALGCSRVSGDAAGAHAGCTTRRKKVIGAWPSCWGFPMLQKTTRSNGSEPGRAASCACSSCACATSSPRTAYSACAIPGQRASTAEATTRLADVLGQRLERQRLALPLRRLRCFGRHRPTGTARPHLLRRRRLRQRGGAQPTWRHVPERE